MVKFSWDEAKNQSNIQKHGIGFARASSIFAGRVVTFEDQRFAYGEKRFISVGKLEEIAIIVVVHTERGGTIRIISARPASRWERDFYETQTRENR